MQKKEQPVCGLTAVKALFDRDPGAIKRLFFDEPTSRRAGAISKAMATARKVYRCVTPEELVKISGTVHHGGIVAIIEARGLPPVRPTDLSNWAHNREPLIVLDRIGNSHNLGAIARTAAFFDVKHLILPDDPQQAVPGESAYRIAEGGLEHLTLHQVKALPAFLHDLRKSHLVIGTALHGERLEAFEKNTLSTATRPVALVLGNEEHGIAPAVAATCEKMIRIEGGGKIESLNVSAAAAILIHALFGKSANSVPLARKGS